MTPSILLLGDLGFAEGAILGVVFFASVLGLVLLWMLGSVLVRELFK